MSTGVVSVNREELKCLHTRYSRSPLGSVVRKSKEMEPVFFAFHLLRMTKDSGVSNVMGSRVATFSHLKATVPWTFILGSPCLAILDSSMHLTELYETCGKFHSKKVLSAAAWFTRHHEVNEILPAYECDHTESLEDQRHKCLHRAKRSTAMEMKTGAVALGDRAFYLSAAFSHLPWKSRLFPPYASMCCQAISGLFRLEQISLRDCCERSALLIKAVCNAGGVGGWIPPAQRIA
ncbi:hypothetical protein EYF80_029942 [Liparis tanakae]|uniref:Uncharacterized protein n=1 Tax=Liparis tanakae TaxID=230148 RepID=A0A4Z2H225_9TELE|nr:hypothetical protein EYF80_029942 [Liparis tanakae]